MKVSELKTLLELLRADWFRSNSVPIMFPFFCGETEQRSISQIRIHLLKIIPCSVFGLAMIWSFALCGESLTSQNYSFEIFKPQDDDHFENIYDIKLGAGTSLWFASWGDGIAQIDETQWRHFSEDSTSPLPSNFVKSLYFHAEGNQLWAATTKGVVVIQGDDVLNVPLPDNFEPTSILMTDDQKILIGSRMGRVVSAHLDQVDELSNLNWDSLLEGGDDNGFSVDEIIQGSDGSIWVARGRSGVVRMFNGMTQNFEPDETGVQRSNQILQLSDNTLILSGSGKPSRYMSGKWLPISPLPPIYRVHELADGCLLFGAMNGNIIIQRDSSHDILWKPDKSNVRIRSIIQDRGGRIWLGAKEGIIKGSQRRWVDTELVPRYKGRFIGTTCIYDETCGWIAINDQNELICYDPTSETWIPQLALPGAPSFDQKMLLSNETLHVFSEGNIYDIDPKSFQLLNTSALPTRKQLTKVEVYGTESIFISSMEGCFVWNGGEWKRFDNESAGYSACVIPSTKTVAIVRNDAVELWKNGALVHQWEEPSRHVDTRFYFVEHLEGETFVAGILGQGLYLLEAGKPLRPFGNSKGLFSKRCTTALRASSGDLWVGFEGGGVACHRNGRWVNFAFENGLRNDTVLGLIEHPSGEIWVTTEDFGVYRLVADQTAPDTRMTRAPNELGGRQLAVFAFEGRDGWNETSEKDLVFSWRITPAAGDSDKHSLTWSEYSSNRSVLIEAPSEPGHYTFQVRAQDRGFNTDTSPAVHQFEVNPPFWKTVGFLAPMLGMTSLAALLALKVFKSHRKIRQHRDELDHRVQERTSELQYISDKLLLEKERLEATLHSTADAVIAIDNKDRITFFNQAALLLVRDGEQLSDGKPLQEVFEFSDHISYKALSGAVDHVTNPNPSGMVTVQKPSGSEFEFEFHTGVVRSGNQIQGFVLAFRDRSPMRELERERQKRSNLESLGLVAGGIAHDFNNYLAAILGNISMIEKLCPEDGKIKNALEQSRLASLHAKSLTKQLLTFSKGGNPTFEHADLAGIIHASAEFCARGTTYQCQFDIDPNLSKVVIDPGQISNVIHNVVLNAMQAMGEGGVVRISASNVTDHKTGDRTAINSKMNGAFVRVTISDSGEGIPANKIDRIFDPYFSSKPNGSGLGLAVCHSIIEQHKGNISVESKPGHGTTVIIDLPLPDDATLSVIKKDPVGDQVLVSESRPLRVLVMDDNDSIRDMLNQFLEVLGHDDVCVKNGHEALQEIRSSFGTDQAFDVCILDLTVPGSMGGLEVATTIRDEGLGAYTIASSGYSESEIQEGHTDSPFDDFLHKPYTVEELDACLKTIKVGGLARGK